jgi:DNA replication protein DnaC
MTDPTIIQVQADEVADPYRLIENREHGEQLLAEKIPAHYRDAVVSIPEVRDWVKGLVTRAVEERRTIPQIRSGPSLMLVGGVGTGKTFAAYGAVRALTMSGIRCPWFFTTAADLYAQLRPGAVNDAEAVLRRHSRIALLVLDDLGASKGSEWTEEINYRLINYRYEHELPTLVTSNVPPKEIPTVLGTRVSSRLSEMATRVVLRGSDRRREPRGDVA